MATISTIASPLPLILLPVQTIGTHASLAPSTHDYKKIYKSNVKQVDAFPYLKTRRVCVVIIQVHYLKLPLV